GGRVWQPIHQDPLMSELWDSPWDADTLFPIQVHPQHERPCINPELLQYCSVRQPLVARPLEATTAQPPSCGRNSQLIPSPCTESNNTLSLSPKPPAQHHEQDSALCLSPPTAVSNTSQAYATSPDIGQQLPSD